MAQAVWREGVGAPMGPAAGCFPRRETRQTLREVAEAVLMGLERISCWTPAEALGRSGPHRLQHLPCRPASRSSSRRCSLFRGWCVVAWADDAVFVGGDGDLDAVAQVEFGEGAGDVAFDGGLAEVEPGGDLCVRESLRDQSDHAEFACAQSS